MAVDRRQLAEADHPRVKLHRVLTGAVDRASASGTAARQFGGIGRPRPRKLRAYPSTFPLTSISISFTRPSGSAGNVAGVLGAYSLANRIRTVSGRGGWLGGA